jgi:lactoylglutathione lyase
MKAEISSILLFVQDLDGCTAFYRDTLQLPYLGSEDNLAAFKLEDGKLVVLLSSAGAEEILRTGVTALSSAGGPRGLVSLAVADVDATYAELAVRGVTFVLPPTDQPWGIRMAHFVDLEGNIWEINREIESKPAGEAEA